MEIVIAAKSGERCHMPLHAFTGSCYVRSDGFKIVLFCATVNKMCYFIIKQKGDSNKCTFLNFGIWWSYF